MLPKLHKNLMFILPFANEFANALTISGALDNTPFKRLYTPCDEKLTKQLQSSVIDFIALFGIMWNVAYMGSKHGTKMGVIYGIVILLLSFIVPNLLMEPIINSLPNSKNRYVKLIGAITFIFILLSIEIYASELLKNLKWKYTR